MTSAASAPDPLMLRVYKGDKKGATAFFRNRAFLDVITRLLADMPGQKRVLFQACSIGAEPYSFAAWSLDHGLDVAVDATDIEPDFVAAAKNGVYPAAIADRMTDAERKWFTRDGDNLAVADDVRARVAFLPAQSLTDPMPGTYDAVFAMNVLTYLTPDGQAQAIQTLARGAGRYLCVTAFHPDTIRADMQAAGFVPVMDDQAAIHNAWGDRVRPNGAAPGTPEYSWVVPPYNTACDDYAYRYGAIFMREGQAR